MLDANEILALILAGRKPVAELSALRERYEIAAEDIAGGLKIEQLEDEDDVAEIEQLNTAAFYLSCAEEALVRGDAAGAAESLRCLPGFR